MDSIELLFSSHNISQPIFPLHNEQLKFHNLVFLKKGSMHYQIDGTKILLMPGDMLYVPKGSRRIREEIKGEHDHYVFNFDSDRPIPLPTVMHDVINGDIFALLAAYDAINKGAPQDHRAKNELLLKCLLMVLRERTVSQNHHPLTRTILTYLHNHFTEKITLQQIGQRTCFSPVYCDAVFKNDMGVSIIEYVLSLRMENAKQLLTEGELSIHKIAESVGFQDHNYFSRVFKKRVGISPSDYRQRF